MEKQDSEFSEQELAQKIIHFHDDLGLGFRRTARELVNQGYKANKDDCNRIYNEYVKSTCADGRDSKGLTRLRLTETREHQRLETQREKMGIRNRLTGLFIERSTMSFEQRRRLFTDPKKLVRFAKRVMPVLDPVLWNEFTEYCETRGYDVTEAVFIVDRSSSICGVQPIF